VVGAREKSGGSLADKKIKNLKFPAVDEKHIKGRKYKKNS
jgi:hypothetical protein